MCLYKILDTLTAASVRTRDRDTTVEFRRTKMFLLMMLLLQFTAAGRDSSVTVRVRGDVTLSCGSLREDQVECDGTTWIFSVSGSSSAVPLFDVGKIHKDARSKSDRLSLKEKCSLVVKNVSAEDVGQYNCKQFESGTQQGSGSLVRLSVVTITEQKDGDVVKFTCSVSMDGDCKHSVKWLYQGKDVGKGHRDFLTSQSLCSVSVSFQTSHYIYGSGYKIFSCNVTDDNNEQQLTFPIQASPEESGEDETIATENNMKAGWWWFVLGGVALLVLLMIAVAVMKLKRTEGNRRGRKENTELSLNPAETPSAPQTGQDTADPEGGVSYVSISFTKKTNSKARVVAEDDDDDDDDAVTYSTVKPSSSSAGALIP
ncbi:uncharacterized protein LOC130187420 isoform X2 [Seriola aureovittata]|uniref:uncharacterized protein LOC130187420 isoform X2 n=1 Tax=Seriola aureovittata TaxID=2871759 RepID=UPI0024BE43D7|nr:uncharacterized protein LOC130187420 isoform X2 [Seriola aureovittata]